MSKTTNLELLAGLAHDAGATLEHIETLRGGRPAGLPSLRPGLDELDGPAAAALELLLKEIDSDWHHRYDRVAAGLPPETSKGLLQLEHCARITGWLLPQVPSHGHPSQYSLVLASARLREYLTEHDRREYVHPREVAGVVADLVDALVLDRQYLLEAA